MSFSDLGTAANPIVIEENSPAQVVVICSSSEDEDEIPPLEYEPGTGAWNVTEEAFIKIISDKKVATKLG